jgi:hypothetical protein
VILNHFVFYWFLALTFRELLSGSNFVFGLRWRPALRTIAPLSQLDVSALRDVHGLELIKKAYFEHEICDIPSHFWLGNQSAIIQAVQNRLPYLSEHLLPNIHVEITF